MNYLSDAARAVILLAVRNALLFFQKRPALNGVRSKETYVIIIIIIIIYLFSKTGQYLQWQ